VTTPILNLPRLRGPIAAASLVLLTVALLPACDDDPASHPSLAVQEDDADPDTDTPEDAGSAATKEMPVTLPDVVTYEIKRGGTLANVANLFKIHHHEILGLNPGLQLTDRLDPGTHVVVYRRDLADPSESIGAPTDGQLQGAVPMLEGTGRHIHAQRYKAWATAATVAQLDRALAQWPEREPEAHHIIVGNMSAREGGVLNPHASHRSGRDVDLSFIQFWDGESEITWQRMTGENLDSAKNWSLMELLVEQGDVEHIFVDYGIQKLLYEHAVAHRTHDPKQLAHWIEYPLPPGSSNAIIKHVPGHVDHLHVRYACRDHDDRCR
jgi:murein endopeptidase